MSSVCCIGLHTSASCISCQLYGLTQRLQCHIVQSLPAILCHLTDPPGAGLERVLSVTSLQRTPAGSELQRIGDLSRLPQWCVCVVRLPSVYTALYSVYVMRRISRYCACTTSSYVACEQQMLTRLYGLQWKVLIDSEKIHTLQTCWNWLPRVYISLQFYQQLCDAIASSDILALSGVWIPPKWYNYIYLRMMASLCYYGNMQFGQPTQMFCTIQT